MARCNASIQVHIVLSLTREYDVLSSGVCILTPYTAQKSLIEKKLRLKYVTDVRVCTIFESQGIVILGLLIFPKY